MLSTAVIGHIKGGSFYLFFTFFLPLMPDTSGNDHKFPSHIFDHIP